MFQFNAERFYQIKLNEEMLDKLGGLFKLEKLLKTSYKNGLSGNEQDLAERVKLYGKNEVSWRLFGCTLSNSACSFLSLSLILGCRCFLNHLKTQR